jgi:hypothetical protein
MLQQTPLAHERAAIARAALARKRNPDDPDAAARVEELRAGYRARLLEEHIRKVVDGLPPLTEDQKRRLSVLLNGASS